MWVRVLVHIDCLAETQKLIFGVIFGLSENVLRVDWTLLMDVRGALTSMVLSCLEAVADRLW